jgi:hypothetical protein
MRRGAAVSQASIMPMSGWRVGGNNVDAVSWAIDLSGGIRHVIGYGLGGHSIRLAPHNRQQIAAARG